jgi:uncharacterized protein
MLSLAQSVAGEQHGNREVSLGCSAPARLTHWPRAYTRTPWFQQFSGRPMDPQTIAAMAVLFALAAALYSSVGHGGASAYIATMALFSVAPETMKPTALALNLLVAGYGAWRYSSRGLSNWKLVLAFAITATPAAYVGGGIHLPGIYYKLLVGILLWLAAARLLWQPRQLAVREPHTPSLAVTVPVGAVLGFLAGLTGTGGGIFLSPLIILLGWEETRRTSGVVSAFIFLNSVAGLAGNVASIGRLPSELPIFLAAVAVGATLGTWLGVARLPRPWLLRFLGAVLLIAGAKLLFT